MNSKSYRYLIEIFIIYKTKNNWRIFCKYILFINNAIKRKYYNRVYLWDTVILSGRINHILKIIYLEFDLFYILFLLLQYTSKYKSSLNE